MRLTGYLYAGAALAAIGAGLVWATGSETRGQDAALHRAGGHRFASVVPSRHEALSDCVVCHRIGRAGPERSAPALTDIVGAPVARADWFGYSPALRAKGGRWTEQALDAYLADPVGEVPGTFKTLPPIRDAEQRARILDALKRGPQGGGA